MDITPHMAINGRTPAMVWNAQVRAKRERQRGGKMATRNASSTKRRSARAPPGS